MKLATMQYFQWFGPAALQLLVLSFMYRRKTYGEFPAFFCYCMLQVVASAFLFLSRRAGYLYYYGFWTTQALTVIATFSVWQEILGHWLEDLEILRKRSLLLLQMWAFLTLVMVIVNARTAGLRSPEIFTSAILLLQKNLRFVECGLAVLLLAFRKRLDISYHDLAFGIALGFAVDAAGRVVLLSVMRGAFPLPALNLALSGVRLVSCAIWLLLAVKSTPATRRLTVSWP